MALFKQERHVELVTGANEAFVITSLMVSASIPTQLPHLNVFVISVADVDDPKQDALARVARLSDLTSLPIGRDAGIATPSAEGIVYLSASSTNVYETLETANAAATAIKDRVNALINAWIDYSTNFVAADPTPALYTLPYTTGASAEVLIAAYKTAKQSRYVKQLEKTEADAALARAQTALTDAQSRVVDVAAMSAAATTNENEMNTLVTNGLTPLINASNVFLSLATTTPPTSSEKLTFAGAISIATAVQASGTTYLGDAVALSASITTYQSDLVSAAAAAVNALVTAQTDQTAKAQLLTSAQVLEAAALAAVLAVCPDFEKNSVPFVDDSEP